MQQAGAHAIVVGASLGGLLAARALAGYYGQVTVLERDTHLPDGEPRRGVPQGRHPHGLLAQGRETLEGLFPGLTQELVARGAIIGDPTQQARWFYERGFHCKFRSGRIGLLMTRPYLEGRVRARVLALPNVRLLAGCDVVGLAASEDRARIIGARVVRLDGLGGFDGRQGSEPAGARPAGEVMPADLVVDASGRGSRTPAWLAALGYPPPTEEQVYVGVGYASRFYRRRPEHLQGDLAAIVIPSREGRRLGALLAQEGDRWIVGLGGYLGDHPPTDEAGFLAFAQSLPVPDIYEVIRDAEPLSAPVPYRFPSSRRRRYERLRAFPAGLLVTGDACCSFNPVYGQGMTVAAMEADALQECLAGGTAHLAQRFFRKVGALAEVPWRMAVTTDLRYPEVRGPRPPLVRFVNWYVSHLHVAARRDPAVALAFQQVANLSAPPATILRPDVAFRVFRRSGSARRDQPAGARGRVPTMGQASSVRPGSVRQLLTRLGMGRSPR